MPGRVHDMNDVVVSRYPQCGDIREAFQANVHHPRRNTKSRENYKTATKTNWIGMLAMAGILVPRLHLVIRVQSSKAAFLIVRIVKPLRIKRR